MRGEIMDIEIFSTCPQSRGIDYLDRMKYLGQVEAVAHWSDQAGYRGILIYTDNGIVDPWLVAQRVIESTHELCPLIAVQPIYIHPYSVAKLVSSLAFLHGRQVYLNMVAGGFVTDLDALADETDHDERYRRLVEYTTIVSSLFARRVPSASVATSTACTTSSCDPRSHKTCSRRSSSRAPRPRASPLPVLCVQPP